MENNEIMNTTEEIVDVVEVAAEELVPARQTNGWKVFGIFGLVLAGAGAAYTFVVKPIIKAHKAKKAEMAEYQQMLDDEDAQMEDFTTEDESEK